MDRNRDARRVTMAASNGLSRRRHRSSSLRDSPEDDGPLELQETARLRDRRKDRDRDRDRDRERDRDRDRDRERDRISSRSKRRRGDRLMHGSNREDGGDDSSEESVNDEEDEDDDDAGGGSMRMLPPNPSSLSSSSLSNHHHRKSFPPPAKVFRAAPVMTPWKAPDEMIGVSVPRKARSASTKRSHESWASSGCGERVVGPEQIHRQTSTSPVRSGGPSVLASASAAASPAAPVSPSSSNVSVKKKMKPNGPKQRPPKSSSKPTSSAQDEIEIEIAEVLYGLMRQPQVPSKQENATNDSMKFDSRDVNNSKSTSDAKSRVSSPIANPLSAIPRSSSIPPTNSSSSATPMSAIAPKRKRPRPVKYEEENQSVVSVRNSLISSTKADIEQPVEIETSLPNLEKNLGSTAENGGNSNKSMANQAAPSLIEPQPELVKLENDQLPDSKTLTDASESKDFVSTKKEPLSPKKDSSLSGDRVDGDGEFLPVNKVNQTKSDNGSHREEKFQIDLMAPPPFRSSPERDSEIEFVAADPKPLIRDVETEIKAVVKEEDKAVKMGKEDLNVEPGEKRAKVIATEEVECQKLTIAHKERNIDLQLDLEKPERDSGSGTVSGNKIHHHVQKQQPQPQPQTSAEKSALSGALPLPMSMAGWPGGLPHMGYMAPLQGVVSMDGTAVSSAAIQSPHLLFSQPRPKRCATHWYIARNIQYQQQIARMNPFWPAAASSALQYGAKACRSAVPSTELHGGRGVNSAQDKGQSLAIFPGHTGKEKISQAANIVDAAQRKQILLQQALPPGAPSNILQGPAFIFPLSQQQAAAAASVRPGTLKSPPAVGSASSSSTCTSASLGATATAVAGATAMSFNYPNIPGNETPYLAILQNGAYPIPIPAHVSAASTYRGTHPPAGMPFLNGSFYSSQMIHPSQLQQQQTPPTQSQQSNQGHQNPSISSGSSSSQKHLQHQQQRPNGSSINGSSGNLQGFPGAKNQPSQSLQLQQRQLTHNQNALHPGRTHENEIGGEDSPSTADSRVSSRGNINIYGQNFAMPLHPPNFALMAPASVGGVSNTGGYPSEKKQQPQPQPQPQPQGSKSVAEPLPTFAMSFTSMNGAPTAPGFDISSIAHNHALLQNLPEATRHGYHFMAAATVPQAKKNNREEGKTEASGVEEERKIIAGGGKAAVTGGQSIAFSRMDASETSVSTIPGNTVVDSSARTINLGSTPARASGSVLSPAISSVNITPGVQQQLQRNQQQQQQQQQLLQLQKQQQQQQQFAAAASARNKAPSTSNGSVYSDHISSSSAMANKFPNALAAFPQNLVQSSSSPVQSPQWKNSARTSTSQIPSPSLTSSSPAPKTLPQQQGRTQQGHTHISFAANPKPSTAQQGQPPPSSNHAPSSPMVVGSPTSSSISKSAGGSPRTTGGNKGGGQSSMLSSQQAKNSPSVSTQKSSPVGGRNIPSILGHPHNMSTSSASVVKPQLPSQQQQQLQKHALQQAHMLYASGYMQPQVQAASSMSTTSATSGFYLQRQQQQLQGPSATSSTGMLPLCPLVTLANSGTTDPAKAVTASAVAASNMKGGGLPSQSLVHAQLAAAQSSGKSHQLAPAVYSYVHAVQVKPADKKQSAGE